MGVVPTAQASRQIMIEKEILFPNDSQIEPSNKDEEGASLVEYALLVALIAVVAIVAIRFLGTAVSTQFSTIGSAVSGG